MGLKHKKAASKRWDGISLQERSKRMKILAHKRWSNKTPNQKKAYAHKMVRARLKKKAVIE